MNFQFSHSRPFSHFQFEYSLVKQIALTQDSYVLLIAVWTIYSVPKGLPMDLKFRVYLEGVDGSY